MENQNDYLIHYGVLGMHWGVRKKEYRVQGAKKNFVQDKKQSKKLTAKKVGTVAAKGATITTSLLAGLKSLNMAYATGSSAAKLATGAVVFGPSTLAVPETLIIAGLASAGMYAAGKIGSKKKQKKNN